jgi:hypothetical protein
LKFLQYALDRRSQRQRFEGADSHVR